MTDPTYKLYPYQVEAALWLADRDRALLADKPRIGKTPALIAATRLLGLERAVVLTRAISRVNWRREFARWGDIDPKNLIVESWERAATNMTVRAEIEALSPDVIIGDECHRVKSISAKRTRAFYGRGFSGGLIESAERVWLASGTPMPNGRPTEMYPHLRALWPDLLPKSARTERGYMEHFCVTRDTPFGPKVVGVRNAAEFRTILKRIMLRRTWEDIGQDIEEIRFSPVTLLREGTDVRALEALERDVRREYERYLDAWINAPEGEEPREPLQPIAELLHAAGRAKVQPVVELIDAEIGEDYDKIVVLAYHRDVLDALAMGLLPHAPVMVHGGTPQHRRQEAIDRFQTDPTCRIYLGQINANSEAITLNAASEVLLVEQTWDPNTNYQAACRVVAPGRTATARVVGLADTLDEAVAESNARKMRNVQATIDHRETAA